METSLQPSTRCLLIRQAMQAHVQKRLQQALAKLEGKKEDATTKQRRQAALEKFQLPSILEKGAAAASRIAISSHIAKGIHPDLKVKNVTNLAVDFSSIASLKELGSHVLNPAASLLDATGDGAYNAAAYELYLLLDSQFEGQKLSSLLVQKDEDAIAALQLGQPDGFAAQCLELLHDKCVKGAAHTLSKQIYWLKSGGDPSDDADFEVLVPLYPASLVHQAYLHIQEHRFGEANKAARLARRERKHHNGIYCEYPNLAVQKLGGSKPQNISHLNLERREGNYLLSSLPPVWKPSAVRLPVGASSIFDKLFIARPEVRRTLKVLRKFLESDPAPNMETREQRESLVDTLVDELVALAGELQQVMPAGWSLDAQRFDKLNRDEQLWLDPLRAELAEQDAFAQEWLRMDWPAEIGKRFGRWLNQQLQNRLPVGDVEARVWAKELLADEDGFKQQLRALRRRLEKNGAHA